MARSGKAGASVDTRAQPTSRTQTPRRQSQRISSSAAKGSTPKRSVYFEHSTDEDDRNDDVSSNAYDDGGSEQSSTTAHDIDDSDASAEDGRAFKRKRGIGKSFSPRARKVARSQELWREGVKSDLQPGEEVYIALPKAREAGKTAYRDNTLHPNTLLFLGDLKKNNERAWLKLHDADFRQSERDWKSFVDQLTEKLAEYDETIPELPAKDIVFRIYRDVRFSNDPTPYKPHFSGAWSRTGRKGPYAAYYLQISPGASFLGGGLWCPESAPLAMLRRDIDQQPGSIKSVLADPGIRREFLKGAGDEKKALSAFLSHNAERALKRHPKGYEEDHPNIGLLRLRSFTLGRKLKDSDITGDSALKNLAKLMGTLTPFITYLNGVVMPDPDAEDASNSES